MKKHTKLYYSYFDLGEQDFVYDEYEWVQNKRVIRADNIHHIDPRGMGGSKEKDYIENLMALSFHNHEMFELSNYPKEWQRDIHQRFIETNPYDKWKKV